MKFGIDFAGQNEGIEGIFEYRHIGILYRYLEYKLLEAPAKNCIYRVFGLE